MIYQQKRPRRIDYWIPSGGETRYAEIKYLRYPEMETKLRHSLKVPVLQTDAVGRFGIVGLFVAFTPSVIDEIVSSARFGKKPNTSKLSWQCPSVVCSGTDVSAAAKGLQSWCYLEIDEGRFRWRIQLKPRRGPSDCLHSVWVSVGALAVAML